MLSLSNRAATLGTENAFVVLAEVAELVAKGGDVVSFCIGQPDFLSPSTSRRRPVRAIREGKHGYTARRGSPNYAGRRPGSSAGPGGCRWIRRRWCAPVGGSRSSATRSCR